jgi:uncharacterized protein YdeI (YjbR/CyaY-like superfamily)
MKNTDKRIDAYISKSADFAKPILSHLRQVVHKNCPEVVETMKWSFPHFVYNDTILCSMASFKAHCAFGFWLSSMMKDKYGALSLGQEREAMGHVGKIQSRKDLPSDKILADCIKEAMQLIDSGAKLQKKERAASSKELEIPAYFIPALKKNKKALATFENFSYSQKKEYVEWVTEAKTEKTRYSRLETAIEWMSEGKIRNWKYLK